MFGVLHFEMFQLVRFHGDNYYHVSPQNEIRRNGGFSAKWGKKFYAAEFIASSNNINVLEDLRENLLKYYPKVVLSRVKMCVNPCEEIVKASNSNLEIALSENVSEDKDAPSIIIQQEVKFDVDHTLKDNPPTMEKLKLLENRESSVNSVQQASNTNFQIALSENSCEDLDASNITTQQEVQFIFNDNTLNENPPTAEELIFLQNFLEGSNDNIQQEDEDYIQCHSNSSQYKSNLEKEPSENSDISNKSHECINGVHVLSGRKSSDKYFEDPFENGNENSNLSDFDTIEKRSGPSNDVKVINKKNLNVSTSKSHSKKYYCAFCQKMVTNYGRHLVTVHKNKKQVQEILKLPKKHPERIQKINKMRTNAQFLHNTDPKLNSGSVVVKRRPSANKSRNVQHYIHCPTCLEMFSKLSLRVHFRKCNQSNDSNRRLTNVFQESRKSVMSVHYSASNRLIRDVLAYSKEDKISDCFLFDDLCILYGNKLTMKYRNKHHGYMIRQRMREMGRFIYEFKKIQPNANNLRDILHPNYYDTIVNVINKIAGLNDKDGKYRAPSTAYNLGLHLKAITQFLESETIKQQDSIKREAVRDLLCLMNEGFSTDINKTVSENQIEYRRHKQVLMPTSDDISCLYKYITKGLADTYTSLHTSFSYKTWKDLAGFTLINIQLFNRRRAGEIERITIEDFKTFRFTDVNDEIVRDQCQAVQEIAKNFGCFFIRGKLNRSVRVILAQDHVDAINIILKYRNRCRVSENNPYVFGITGRGDFAHLRACVLMRFYAKACGATNPMALRGTELRKHVATKCSIFKLSDPLVQRVADHLGHKLDIHKSVYRQPQQLEVTELVPVLMKCLGLDDHDEDEKQVSLEQKRLSSPFSVSGSPEKNIQSTNYIESLSPISKPMDSSSSIKRIPWSSPERIAINDSFGELIEYGITPTYEECNEIRRKYSCLEKRTPPQIKSFVAYQTKKLQKGTPKNCKIAWSTVERQIVRCEFKKYLTKGKLPPLTMCNEVINKYPILSSRTPVQLKGYINNQNRKAAKNAQ